MGEKGRTTSIILALLGILSSLTSCIETAEDKEDIYGIIHLTLCKPEYKTRAFIPDEDKINDLNIVVIEGEKIEEIIWRDGMEKSDEYEFDISLVKGRTYTIAAIANIGRRLELSSHEDLKKLIVEMTESDRYPHGIPMSAVCEDIHIGNDTSAHKYLRFDTRKAAA